MQIKCNEVQYLHNQMTPTYQMCFAAIKYGRMFIHHVFFFALWITRYTFLTCPLFIRIILVLLLLLFVCPLTIIPQCVGLTCSKLGISFLLTMAYKSIGEISNNATDSEV